jgi:hypothetical protein
MSLSQYKCLVVLSELRSLVNKNIRPLVVWDVTNYSPVILPILRRNLLTSYCAYCFQLGSEDGISTFSETSTDFQTTLSQKVIITFT